MRWIGLFAFLLAAFPTAASAAPFDLGFAQPSGARLHLLNRDLTLGGAAAAASLVPTHVVDDSLFGATGHSAIRSDVKPVLALVLGLVVGFGTGHLVAGDTQGFIMFLLIDAAILVGSAVLAGVSHVWWAVGGVALLVSHVVQGILAYQEAGGSRIVELTRKRTIELASGDGQSRPAVTRLLAVAF